jgi:hypothetical protein
MQNRLGCSEMFQLSPLRSKKQEVGIMIATEEEWMMLTAAASGSTGLFSAPSLEMKRLMMYMGRASVMSMISDCRLAEGTMNRASVDT